jgi:glycosyltransferase involved in cell wall biosynthesis
MWSKNLKVCNVDEEGRFGGPERRIIQVARALYKYNIETLILLPKLDSDIFKKNIDRAGVKSISLSITRLSKEKIILFRYILLFWIEVISLVRFFRKQHIDLVHVNGSYQFKVAIGAWLARIPVLWHLNDTYAPSGLKKVFHIVALICADGFIVAGQRVRDYYIAGTFLDGNPVAEVHAPVDISIFDPLLHVTPLLDNKDEIVVGTVSGVNPAKGLEYFVESAIKVLAENSKVQFVVAGAVLGSQKQYYARIKQKLKQLPDPGRLRFCGLVDDVPAFLAKLDICVFSSVTEASPTSIWEAMAMAKPIVTTDVGSVNQHIINGVSGSIVPVRDTALLATKIIELINDPLLRKKYGEAARKIAVSDLDVDSAARKHSEI